MKNAGKARSYGLYRHLRTSKEIIENLLNYSYKNTIRSTVQMVFCVGGIMALRHHGLRRLREYV